MTHGFDKDYWEQHWREGQDGVRPSMNANPPNPYLAREIGDLQPGTALDAGCGSGAEAIWLAEAGWEVTAADISSVALAGAVQRAKSSGVAERLAWVEADLSTWCPDAHFDLAMTHYAHPAIPQLDFYERIAEWVVPGGTLLIVGHLHTEGHAHHGHGDAHQQHPPEASVTAASITERLDDAEWEILTADEPERTVQGDGHRPATLHDVVVRATRRL